MKINVSKDGPYIVYGNVPLIKEKIVEDKDKCSEKWEKIKDYPKKENYILCRCGYSKTPPYCDSTHLAIGFNGEEKKQRSFKEMAKEFKGDEITLFDAYDLCSCAAFCERKGRIWNLINDKKNRKIVEQEAFDCPSGRLVIHDKNGEIEPKLNKEISVTEHPGKGCSGPLWVKGGIQVESASGENYELRNKVTLCRCGASKNKPFCDCSHVKIGFKE
jgi:CDGSH-type Zn-finger protein